MTQKAAPTCLSILDPSVWMIRSVFTMFLSHCTGAQLLDLLGEFHFGAFHSVAEEEGVDVRLLDIIPSHFKVSDEIYGLNTTRDLQCHCRRCSECSCDCEQNFALDAC
ncbi:hypothetical protein AVEN_132088-1 [Araneus ventricosus]|uniref:Uncharacterized protein n=1 Tax=Araneus ventricosus TaxID=182803 RepID=A0A4Y2F860_ARAVE|nr:hypothetical protein AVEN_132088-1 [Araneus ventricosus]